MERRFRVFESGDWLGRMGCCVFFLAVCEFPGCGKVVLREARERRKMWFTGDGG